MGINFEISVEPEIDLVNIAMSGFFVDIDVKAFAFALESKMAQLRCGPNHHLTLCDVRGMDIQTQNIVASFAQIVGHPKFRSKRLAFVTRSSLARMQTRRLTDREGVTFYTDMAEARKQLLNPSGAFK